MGLQRQQCNTTIVDAFAAVERLCRAVDIVTAAARLETAFVQLRASGLAVHFHRHKNSMNCARQTAELLQSSLHQIAIQISISEPHRGRVRV